MNIKWNRWLDEENINDPYGKPLAVKTLDGRIFQALDSTVGKVYDVTDLRFDPKKQDYVLENVQLEVVWSGHRDDGNLCKGRV